MKEALTVTAPVSGAVVTMRGRIDVQTVGLARDVLHAAVDAGSGTLFLDVSEVHLLDVAGLGMLVGTQRRAERAGRRLVLRGTPPRLRRLLRATRLERVLPTVNLEPVPTASTAGCEVAVPAQRRVLTALCPDDAA